MKLSIKGTLSLVVSFLVPIVGMVSSFLTYKKGKERFLFLTLSVFAFSVTCYLPPLQDLYRRYTLNYLPYNELTTYSQAIEGHVDILMYVILLFLKKNSIPFLLMPALEAALSVYLGLSSIKKVIAAAEFNEKKEIFIYFLSFLMMNFVGVALGLRFGAAVTFFIYGATVIFTGENKVKGAIFLLLAVLMHFSMLVPVAVLIGSFFVNIHKRFTPLYCVIAYLASNFIFFSLFNSIQLGDINSYAESGYIDGKYASADTSGNAIIMIGLKLLFFAFLYSIYYMSKNKLPDSVKNAKAYESFLNMFFIVCFIFSISFSAFSRYLNGVLIYFIFTYVMLSYPSLKKLTKFILVSFVILNFSLQYVYAQRRALLYGEMWRGLYTSPLIILNSPDELTERYLRKIDQDGNEIGVGYPSR